MHPLIPIHIAAGGVALIAGAAALVARKGGRAHARSGTWFFAAMLAMAGTGSVIAFAKPERGTAMIGILTCYLVATSWMSARRRDGHAGRFEVAGFAVALACSGFARRTAASTYCPRRSISRSQPWRLWPLRLTSTSSCGARYRACSGSGGICGG
jgi:uncharacterized membrane protein YfcA